MTYAGYVIAAYAVFAVVLMWDYLATRLRIRRALLDARDRAVRAPVRARRKTSMETQ